MSMYHRQQRLTASFNGSQAPRSQPMRHSLGVLPSERSADREAFEHAMVHRHSAPPTFERESSVLSAKVIPEHMLMQTTVAIVGLAVNEDHCVYLIQVDTGFGGIQTIHKRFSEIRDFRVALREALAKKAHCGHGPCAQLTQLSQLKFPHRRLRFPGLKPTADLDVAQSRMKPLERFLQAVLRVYRVATRRQMRVCNNSRCVTLDTIQRFLDVPVLTERSEDPAAVDISVDYKMSVAKAGLTMGVPSVRYSFSNFASGDDTLSPLFSILEDSEPVAA